MKLPWHGLESSWRTGVPVLTNNKNENEGELKRERERERRGHTEFLLHGFERWGRDHAYYAHCTSCACEHTVTQWHEERFY
jgi:hypothetical protein